MIKTILLAGAATLVATPALAQQVTGSGSVTFNNNISTSVVTNTEYNQAVGLFGTVNVSGNVAVDSAATAVTDNKQITIDQTVGIDSTGDMEAGDMGATRNLTDTGVIAADGNVGRNAASGWYNTQANVMTIGIASGGVRDATEEAGGMATANTTSAQYLSGTAVLPTGEGEEGEEGGDRTVTRNVVLTGGIGGSGNIQSNGASGAFNQQQNLTTMAIATDSSLANATTGLVQLSAGNVAVAGNSVNYVDTGAITGAGNIHSNVASGVGNQQTNSLTIAASGSFGANGVGGAGGGGR